MNIGDIVSISGMGTNDSSSTLEQFKAYDEAYMNAIIDMGGYVILGSYTPSEITALQRVRFMTPIQ